MAAPQVSSSAEVAIRGLRSNRFRRRLPRFAASLKFKLKHQISRRGRQFRSALPSPEVIRGLGFKSGRQAAQDARTRRNTERLRARQTPK